MRKKVGGKAGRYRNSNAVKHGGYMQLFAPDQRTVEAKILNQIEAELVSAIGGDPSPQEVLILKRTTVKALRCAAMERMIVSCKGEISERLQKDYLRWARELREDLKVLGLERRQSQVVDLHTYIEISFY